MALILQRWALSSSLVPEWKPEEEKTKLVLLLQPLASLLFPEWKQQLPKVLIVDCFFALRSELG